MGNCLVTIFKKSPYSTDLTDLQSNAIDRNFVLFEPKDEKKRKNEHSASVIFKKRMNKFRTRQPSDWGSVDKEMIGVEYARYDYPFENLVFEGGGNKGLAYCGSLQVLEDLGMTANIKRVAGTSAGAMTAALFALGYNAVEIEGFLCQNLDKIFLDHSFGYLSLLPNIIKKFGWNPGNRIFEWFGDVICNKTGNPDFTFKMLYETKKIELCIIVTNLNQMNTLYCHVKTTPNMPIRVALRMSMAIPGMFAAVRYTTQGQTDIYVDGGVLCNYAIHCFDGWWLSLKEEDSFFHRLRPLSSVVEKLDTNNRFGEFNEHTLGFLLYANHEEDIFRVELESRRGVELPVNFPDTKLFRQYQKQQDMSQETAREHNKAIKAADAFLEALFRHDVNRDQIISFSEFEAAFSDEEIFKKDHAMYLFGPNVTADVAFRHIVKPGKDGIEYEDLTTYLQKSGIDLQTKFLGYRRRDIKNLVTFLDSLQNTLLTNVKKIYMQERDICRTVGINTGYIGTNDFSLEPPDRHFLVEQGRRSVISFLKYYVVNNQLRPRQQSPDIQEEAGNSVFDYTDATVISFGANNISQDHGACNNHVDITGE